MSYYRGDLAADLKRLEDEKYVGTLEGIGKAIGYGRAQQILQILWAKSLQEASRPTMGALLPEPLVPRMIDSPAVCNKCGLRHDASTTGKLWNSCCNCGGELVTVTPNDESNRTPREAGSQSDDGCRRSG